MLYIVNEYNFNAMLTLKDLDINASEYSSDRLKSLAHPLRIEILELLAVNKKMTVTQIFEKLNIEQPVASNHLGILKSKDVLLSSRKGKYVHYSLNEPLMKLIIDAVNKLNKL